MRANARTEHESMWNTPKYTVNPPSEKTFSTADAPFMNSAIIASGRKRIKLFLERVQLTPHSAKKQHRTIKRADSMKALSSKRSAKPYALSSTLVPKISLTIGATASTQYMK